MTGPNTAKPIARPTLATAAALACLVAAVGCAKGRVAPGEETGTEEPGFVTTVGAKTDVELTVTDRKWAASTQHILIRHSALWVELENRGTYTVTVKPTDFALTIAGEVYPAIPPEVLIHDGAPGSLDESRITRTLGFRLRTLEPGHRAQGFLFFERRVDADEEGDAPVTLVVDLEDDAQDAVVERLEVSLAIIE